MDATCPTCLRDDVEVTHGKVVKHAWGTHTCRGSGCRPVEAREKDRLRRLAKKQLAVDAARGEAAVLLDMLLLGREDLAKEFDLDVFRKRALDRYQLALGKRASKNAVHWQRRPDGHWIYCVFCTCHIVTIPLGYWVLLTAEEKGWVLSRHTTICALQVLAGIRELAPSALRLNPGNGHEMLLLKTSVPAELSTACGECGAPYGLPCFSTYIPKAAEPPRSRRRKRCHDVRYKTMSDPAATVSP
jgi:hypothetical protein